MQQPRHWRYASILTAAALFVLSVGVGAITFFEFPISISLNPNELFLVQVGKDVSTGFSIRNADSSVVTLNGVSTFDSEAGLQDGQQVQEGFVLLDGTLSLDVDARKLDGTRARSITTFKLDVRRGNLTRDFIARTLLDRGIVRTRTRARTRARHMTLDDARIMRLVTRRDNTTRWKRAVRTISDPRERSFRGRMRPDGIVGHYGFTQPPTGDPYVWAVMDHNSVYAVGLTVDRDSDGVPNSSDNCVGSANSNQIDTDGDEAGDDCDMDDDNDTRADAADNCPLAANRDQFDLDHDGQGDACDADDDNDGVLDVDECQATSPGGVVGGNGCSIADTCPCENSWRNHGAYVKCVAQTSNSFFAAGLITGAQRETIVSAAARSSCGF